MPRRRRWSMAVVAALLATAAVVAPGGPVEVPSAEAACTISVTVRYGSRGTAVSCVQSRLNTLGYKAGPVDGWFGSMTLSAVRAFQRAKGLYVDGVVGPKTATALGIWAASSSCRPPAGTPSTARQVVLVTASGSYARVDLLVSVGGVWTCARSNMTGRVGRNGIRPLALRRSGDGTTPSGMFPLATMTGPDGRPFQFFGNGANPGVRGSWRQVRAGDCWVATPYVAAYNTLVTRSAAACRAPDEYLASFTGAYSQAAVIGANVGPNRSGDRPGEPALAAAIFLHRFSYDSAGRSRPTSGCVSLAAADLAAVLRQLVPGQAWFVIR